jgi:hypothetical protein
MVDDSVGYRKPPKDFQFKKGASGNRRGRPKRKPLAASETIDSVLNATAEYRERGQTKAATRRELTIKTHVNLALKGDVKSAETLLKLRAHAQRYGDAGVQKILMTDWLPDNPGQTGEQKTREFATKNEAELPDWWAEGGSDDPSGAGSQPLPEPESQKHPTKG